MQQALHFFCISGIPRNPGFSEQSSTSSTDTPYTGVSVDILLYYRLLQQTTDTSA